MANIFPGLCVSLATMIAIYTFVKWLRGPDTSHLLPLPPGPKGLPLIGNLRDLPPNDVPEHERWLSFKDRYGPLSSITVPGQTMILIHDREVAVELMEKRANRYSERMHLKFGNDMCGWGNILASLPYGASHRLYRKYTYRQIGTKAALSSYQRLQEGAVGRFLSRLSRDDGSNLVHHLNSETAEIILEIVYGYTVDAEGGDPLLHKINEALRQVSAAFVPGRWAVDMFPMLEHIPDWFPGAGFKQTARYWNQTLMYVINVPFELVKTQMSLGHARTSFVSKSIGQARHEGQFGPDDEHAIKWAAGSMYAAGADTSVSIMTAFFLAMSMFPDVQKKAQEEIERVVGTSRLPTFSDRENLPYINAVVEEAQRWHPILPLGLPHVASREDSINGVRIPTGAILLPAIWWFTRDPTAHHKPEEFKPERFLEPYNEPSATNVIFGFGRRICPGKTLADATLFITIAQSLAALSIKKAVDENGQEIEPDHVFGNGIIALPGPFKARIAPRSKKYEDLIEKAGEQFALKQKGAESLKDLGSGGKDGAW